MNVIYTLVFGDAAARVPVLLALTRSRSRLVRKIVRLVLERSHGVMVANGARIHPTVRFPHPTSIVIGNGVIIGEGTTIYQNVTIGAVRMGDASRDAYPVIGQRVNVYCGAKILGSVRVGNDATIGAGSVVLEDVDAGATVVGIPARAVKEMHQHG